MLNIVEMGIEQPCMAKPNSEIVSVLFIIHLFNARMNTNQCKHYLQIWLFENNK
jgi:hypothetical protein